MGLPEPFQSSTIFLKICLMLAPLGGLLHLIGLSSNFWSAYKTSDFESVSGTPITVDFSIGLWQHCINGDCNMIGQPEAWLVATRAMAILGLFGAGATVLLVIMTSCIAQFSQRKVFHIGALVASIVAAGFLILTIVIYGTMSKAKYAAINKPNWSFGVDCAAMVLFIITTLLLIINVLKKRE